MKFRLRRLVFFHLYMHGTRAVLFLEHPVYYTLSIICDYVSDL